MKRLIVVLMGGIGMGLGTAPFSLSFLAYFAMVTLWIALSDRCWLTPVDDRKELILRLSRSPWILGAIWGLGYHGLTLFWITGVHPLTWMGVPWIASLGIAAFCWLAITVWGMVLVSLWAVSFSFIVHRAKLFGKTGINATITKILLGVSLWCILESLWSRSSLWWSSLALTQSPNNLYLLQWSQFSGVITVVAAIVALNALLAESGLAWFQHQKQTAKTLAIAALLLLTMLLTIGGYLYAHPVAKNSLDSIKIGIIQGNIPNEIKLYPEGWRKAIAGYTTGYQTLARQGVDVVLTPETALPYRWQDIVAHSGLYPAILQEKTPIWLGAFGQKGDRLTNSLLTITGEGVLYSEFDKIKLVPLGEYIPFKTFFGKFIRRLSPIDTDLRAGDSPQRFLTPFGLAAVGICYESAFAEHFRSQVAQGAEFILSSANNAHYSSSMPAQHHAQDVIRAIENDRWLARATNTGYSALINPRGQTIWKSGLNRYEIHSGSIYRRQTLTPYLRWGNWLTPTLVALSLVGIGLGRG